MPAAEFHVADAADFRVSGQVRRRGLDLRQPESHPRTDAVSKRRSGTPPRRLKPGAPFAFDMLLEEAYQTHWGEDFALVRDDHVLTITGAGFDFRTRMAQCTITMFRLLRWRVAARRPGGPGAVLHTQEIESALRRAGFGEILCYGRATSGWPPGLAKAASSLSRPGLRATAWCSRS